MKTKRKYPIGAELQKNGTHFRIWAPDHSKAKIILEKENEMPSHHAMKKEKGGYFSIFIPDALSGALYRFQLGNSKKLLSDPASRFQPLGPEGPSCVINPAYNWTDKKWPGVTREGQIIYEMHIGTFTSEGTFAAAMNQLNELANLGITLIEIMPINDFPGHFGWGYDGVNLFSPTRLYGSPNDLKAFVNKAHSLGMGVILDVVYNHLGPDHNHLHEFTKKYFTDEYTTDWGAAINFNHPSSREFFLTNAKYWIDEYHFDGLRIDATDCIFSSTSQHILADLTLTAKRATSKNILIIGENEQQKAKLLHPQKKGGYGFDALWNDDFHHTALVRLTGKREAYYTDYLGTPQEFISSMKYGFLYQGQYYSWQKKNRGTPDLTLPSSSFIVFLENHDQVANTLVGKRIQQISHPGDYKALTALLLLSMNTPMLFQGQEFGSSSPFLYFAEHSDHLNKLIYSGRKKFLKQFPRFENEVHKSMLDPNDPLTFTRCKLDFTEREKNKSIYLLHKDLIKLRQTDPVFSQIPHLKIDGAIFSHECFLIRYFGGALGDRLLIINFGFDHLFSPTPEPLLTPPLEMKWELLWSTESVIYGGEGTPSINSDFWKILGHSLLVLRTKKIETKAKRNAKHTL